MVDVQGATDTLDVVGIAIPALQPELVVLAAGIPRHVHKHCGEFVGQPQDTLCPRLQQLAKALDCPVRDVEPWGYELSRLHCGLRHRWRRLSRCGRFLDLSFPVSS